MRLLIKNSLLCYVQSVVGITSDEDIEDLVQLHWHWREAKKALELLSKSTDNFFVRPLNESGGSELAALYAEEIIQQFDRLSREYNLDELPEFCTTSVLDLPPRAVDQVKPSILSETTLGRLLAKIDQIEEKLKLLESSQRATADPVLVRQLIEASVGEALAPICSGVASLVNHLTENCGKDTTATPTAVLEKSLAPIRDVNGFNLEPKTGDNSLNPSAATVLGAIDTALACSEHRSGRTEQEMKDGRNKVCPSSTTVEESPTEAVYRAVARPKRALFKDRFLLVAGTDTNRFKGHLNAYLWHDPRVEFISAKGASTRDIVNRILGHSALQKNETSVMVIIHIGIYDIVKPYACGGCDVEEVWLEMESALNDLIGAISFRSYELVVCSVPLVAGYELVCGRINSRLEAKLSGSAIVFMNFSEMQRDKQTRGLYYGEHETRIIAKDLAFKAAAHLGLSTGGQKEKAPSTKSRYGSRAFFRSMGRVKKNLPSHRANQFSPHQQLITAPLPHPGSPTLLGNGLPPRRLKRRHHRPPPSSGRPPGHFPTTWASTSRSIPPR